LPQRSRWFKGWYQTWLVHMRHPVRLVRELGPLGFTAFQLMILGMIVSALMHPFLLYFIIASALEITARDLPTWKLTLLWVDMFTVIFGYLAFALLALRTLPMRRLQPLISSLWMLPAYWVLMSVAAWRAVWQLARFPHQWEKTPHVGQTRMS